MRQGTAACLGRADAFSDVAFFLILVEAMEWRRFFARTYVSSRDALTS
jgi:hypothetical protein